MLYFKCKACGGAHHSPISFGSRRAFETSDFSGNSFRCPKTGRVASYDKPDMVWQERDADQRRPS